MDESSADLYQTERKLLHAGVDTRDLEQAETHH
jgi:hypothetical protein